MRLSQWPGATGEVHPPNATLKLYGGAAFERALNEFQLAVETLEFPKGMQPVKTRAMTPASSQPRCSACKCDQTLGALC